MSKNSIKIMWDEFKIKNPDYNSTELPESFYFCDNQKDADDCAELVVKGIKQATAGSQWSYDYFDEKPGKVGELFIITDFKGLAKAIIKITKIVKTPYKEITEEFAKIEGEGDKSLKYWKDVHWAYFSREREPYNEKPNENMLIVCEYFDTIWS